MPEEKWRRGLNEAYYCRVRERWLAGSCPCCGLDGIPGDVSIAEGVRLCKVCEYHGHHLDEEHVEELLRSLVPAREQQ